MYSGTTEQSHNRVVPPPRPKWIELLPKTKRTGWSEYMGLQKPSSSVTQKQNQWLNYTDEGVKLDRESG